MRFKPLRNLLTFTTPLLALLFAGLQPAAAQTAGQETFGRTTWWLPENFSTYGGEIDMLFYVILIMTGVTGVGVFGLMGYFLIRYRYQANRTAVFSHGNIKLEAVWTLIPTLILALTAALSQGTWAKIKNPEAMPQGEDVVHLAVIGRQFKWYFHYPGKDGILGPRKPELIPASPSTNEEFIGLDRSDPAGKDDVVSMVMYVPVGKKIVCDLTSVDVLHSFFLPHHRVKQDTVPGLIGKTWFESTKTSAEAVGRDASGNPKPFDIVCAELCGQGHYTMRGMMYVVEPEAYQAWLEEEYQYLPGAGGGF